MPAANNDLTTLNNALVWLGCQSDDAYGTLQRVVTAVSTAIQNLIGRDLHSAEYTEVFDGRGRSRIMVSNWPITGVSSVILGELATVSVPARSNVSPGYTFSDKFIYVDSPYFYDKGKRNVKFVYTAGYDPIPLDVEQGCLIWIKAIMDGANYSAALKTQSAGQSKLDWSHVLTRLDNLTLFAPPAVISMISPYRKVTPTW